jgi:threonyl-tRNA synthetase
MIQITLPDGSRREFPAPSRWPAWPLPSAPAWPRPRWRQGRRQARRHQPPHRADAALAIVTDKDADGLEMIRHSTAHLLAYAVKELFPEAQVTIGPVIENGFYYDFAYKRPFTPDDLAAIEQRMGELAKKDEPVVRRVLPRDEAVEHFKARASTTRPRSSAASRPTRTCRCTAKAASKTCAAARTCPARASSSTSS